MITFIKFVSVDEGGFLFDASDPKEDNVWAMLRYGSDSVSYNFLARIDNDGELEYAHLYQMWRVMRSGRPTKFRTWDQIYRDETIHVLGNI